MAGESVKDALVRLSDERFQWQFPELCKLMVLTGCMVLLIANVPNGIWQNDHARLAASLGLIGVWRYGWWAVHFVRAQLFRHVLYARRRKEAEALWATGWRPGQLYFMMTTYREDRTVTKQVVGSILRECKSVGVPATLFVGTGDARDEEIIEDFLKRHGDDTDLETVIVRQNQPGKRFAIGLVLRSMSRHGVRGNSPVVFMDGDSVLMPGCLRRCLPLFGLDENLQALTTNEKVFVQNGPGWFRTWLNMRFAQRHLAMQSHAVSKKVLTLTGRMSVFRADNVTRHDFIRTVEADHLNHWLWREFRFLSGDDKSTWYWLLKAGAEMYYVPDALVVTIERLDGDAKERMVQNLLRWSGNVLRNGTRAIRLGPRRVGLFIWWCIFDQRVAMWTTLIGPATALILTVGVSPLFLPAYFVWVLVTRTLLALLLYPFAGRIDVGYPVFLYANQVINALVKVYIVFRLPRQRWMNRGDQRAMTTARGMLEVVQNSVAAYVTVFWVSSLVVVLLIYLDFIDVLPFLGG